MVAETVTADTEVVVVLAVAVVAAEGEAWAEDDLHVGETTNINY